MQWSGLECFAGGMCGLLMDDDQGKEDEELGVCVCGWGVEWTRVGKRAGLKARLNNLVNHHFFSIDRDALEGANLLCSSFFSSLSSLLDLFGLGMSATSDSRV